MNNERQDGKLAWKRHEYWLDGGTHTVVKVSIRGEVQYEAWRKMGRLLLEGRLATAAQAKRICEQDAHAAKGAEQGSLALGEPS